MNDTFWKIFGIALFLMIIISFSTIMFYPEDVTAQEQYDNYVQQNYLNEDAILDFIDWINTQFIMSKNMIINDYSQLEAESEFKNNVPLSDKVHGRLTLDYNYGIKNSGGWGYWKEKYLVFEIFDSGYSWWENSPSLRERHWFGLFGTNMKEDIKNIEYIDYLKEYGYDIDENGDLYEYEKNILDYALSFLGSLGGAFTSLLDVLTFNFHPDGAPPMFGNIVSIFLYPMVAIITVGIGLVAAKFISAIGNLIPFT